LGADASTFRIARFYDQFARLEKLMSLVSFGHLTPVTG